MKWFMIPLALALTACDRTPPQPETAQTSSPVFDTQIQAMKKAQAVEGQVMDAADAQRKQIDDTTKQ